MRKQRKIEGRWWWIFGKNIEPHFGVLQFKPENGLSLEVKVPGPVYSGFAYPFLSNPKADVVRRYDLLHPDAGLKGADISHPAEFLNDATGTIRWVNLTEDAAVRAPPEQVLKAFDDPSGQDAR